MTFVSHPHQKKQQLLDALHIQDAFNDFEPRTDVSCWGWNSDRQIFEQLIRSKHPAFIIEVGTWLGASAIHMAQILKRHECDNTVILCIDTWLGSKEHWQGDGMITLALRNGFPTLYKQFLSNVVILGAADAIVPLPLPSAIAARLLKDLIEAGSIPRPDMVYIDGSHDEEDVLDDMRAYWDLLPPGGALFGDDWVWENIRNAAARFSEEVGVPFEHDDMNWLFYKGNEV